MTPSSPIVTDSLDQSTPAETLDNDLQGIHTNLTMELEEEYAVPSWLEQELKGLEEAANQLTGEFNQPSRLKIQKIPRHLSEREEFRKYYEPEIISIGPVHLRKAVQGSMGSHVS
ncbi:hypothetical protein PIB30_034888 [Stylosanthes scabra]|uniref:Uncharacterized protein n=1 Tax=Stylosanthes scabra TaxID=79078 RepID=A0ABU6SD61_9FABA|nr:hypothetical protein [Stylosanthes scabra]